MRINWIAKYYYGKRILHEEQLKSQNEAEGLVPDVALSHAISREQYVRMLDLIEIKFERRRYARKN